MNSMDKWSLYQSPFTWRYASEEMRQIWSEVNKRRLWRQVWIALAQAQTTYQLVSAEQVEDLKRHADEIDMARAVDIESQIHHDLMAELKTFAEQAPIGGPILHLGATSMDIEDNAEVLRIKNALSIILKRLQTLLNCLCDRIEQYADLPVIAYTHLQPAEPSTLGYRFSLYAQDFLADYNNLQHAQNHLRGKGFKGAVGTAAAYVDLIGSDNYPAFEQELSRLLRLNFYPATHQTYPRSQDYHLLSALAGLGASLYKTAFDLRILQSAGFGELSEPFGESQVGSSAMPFKRNPINSEKIDSLARMLSLMPQVAWQNAGNSLLERTLDDSANRRSLIAEAFLISDELLITAIKIVEGLVVNNNAIEQNLAKFAPFSATERILMAASKNGANRQEMHELLRIHALQASQAVQDGKNNTLIDSLKSDPAITLFLSSGQIDELLDMKNYTGIAVQRSREMAAAVRELLNQDESLQNK